MASQVQQKEKTPEQQPQQPEPVKEPTPQPQEEVIPKPSMDEIEEYEEAQRKIHEEWEFKREKVRNFLFLIQSHEIYVMNHLNIFF